MGSDLNSLHLRYQDDGMFRNKCIYCSVSSYSISSCGCTNLKVSQCDLNTCQNCLSKFCKSCVEKMIESVERSNINPSTLKNEDSSYRRLQEFELHFISGSITTSSGPCCSFIDSSSSTLIKTLRPNPITPCGRINSIKQYQSSISKMKSDNLVAFPVDKICLEQYFEDPILTSYEGVFQEKSEEF
jgi:hypothetical protein